MHFFFRPRGIALIGATANPEKGGHAILKNLTRGFDGPVYPVNPRYRSIEGLAVFTLRIRSVEPAVGSVVPEDAKEQIKDAAGILDGHRAKGLLAACRIPTVAEEIVADVAQAEAFARAHGYPVVLKGLMLGAVHKTEQGLVRLGLASPEALATA
jgi:acetyltransferase